MGSFRQIALRGPWFVPEPATKSLVVKSYATTAGLRRVLSIGALGAHTETISCGRFGAEGRAGDIGVGVCRGGGRRGRPARHRAPGAGMKSGVTRLTEGRPMVSRGDPR